VLTAKCRFATLRIPPETSDFIIACGNLLFDCIRKVRVFAIGNFGLCIRKFRFAAWARSCAVNSGGVGQFHPRRFALPARTVPSTRRSPLDNDRRTTNHAQPHAPPRNPTTKLLGEGLTELTEATESRTRRFEQAEKQIQALHQPGAIGTIAPSWRPSKCSARYPLSRWRAGSFGSTR
jgi:hypothetical protein